MILHCLLHQLFNLLHIVALFRIKALIVHLLRVLFLLIFFMLFSFTDAETILLGQLFHQFLAVPVLVLVGDLPAVLIYAHGYYMVVLAIYVVVTVDDEGLVPIAQALHQLFRKSDHLVLRHPVRPGRIDRHMERHLFAPAAAALIALERFQRFIRIVESLGIDHGSLALLHLPFIVLESGRAVRRGCVDFHYHII